MHRHGRGRQPDADFDPVVAQQQADLLRQVVAEEVRARDRGGIGARLRHVTKAEPAVDLVEPRRGQPDLGIVGAQAHTRVALSHCFQEPVPQENRRRIVQFAQPLDRLVRVFVAFLSRYIGRDDL